MRWSSVLIRAAGLAFVPVFAFADQVWNACTFTTLPSMVYPEDPNADRTVRIGDRAPVGFEEGQGQGRVASARLDGYAFSFTSTDSTLTVERENGDAQISETGRCVSVNRPIVTEPLDVAGLEEETEVAATPPDIGDWDVREDRSSFVDTTSIYLSLKSEEPIPGRFGGSDYATLHLRCMENRTNLFVIAAGHFLSDIQGYGRVDYRIDDLPASRWSMNVSTDNEALGLWSGNGAIPEIKRLFGGDRMVVRLTPFNESPLEFAFRIRGVEQAVGPLREACGW